MLCDLAGLLYHTSCWLKAQNIFYFFPVITATGKSLLLLNLIHNPHCTAILAEANLGLLEVGGRK